MTTLIKVIIASVLSVFMSSGHEQSSEKAVKSRPTEQHRSSIETAD